MVQDDVGWCRMVQDDVDGVGRWKQSACRQNVTHAFGRHAYFLCFA